MEGYGTDVYIHLNRLSSSREPLQWYHRSSMRLIIVLSSRFCLSHVFLYWCLFSSHPFCDQSLIPSLALPAYQPILHILVHTPPPQSLYQSGKDLWMNTVTQYNTSPCNIQSLCRSQADTKVNMKMIFVHNTIYLQCTCNAWLVQLSGLYNISEGSVYTIYQALAKNTVIHRLSQLDPFATELEGTISHQHPQRSSTESGSSAIVYL